MPSYIFAKKNTEFIIYVPVTSQAAPFTFQTNPTLASGDAKVSTDGGAFSNLDTLPVVTPAGGKLVKITLSATEMNGDNIQVILSDAAGDEWADLVLNIQTTLRQADDLVFSTSDPNLNAAIADSVPADGTAPSIPQALYMLSQFMFDRGVSGTTVTIRKPDGATSLFTLTLNDATTPTDVTRAT